MKGGPTTPPVKDVYPLVALSRPASPGSFWTSIAPARPIVTAALDMHRPAARPAPTPHPRKKTMEEPCWLHHILLVNTLIKKYLFELGFLSLKAKFSCKTYTLGHWGQVMHSPRGGCP